MTDMIRKITDAGVAGLPVAEGRAELLEEIMATAPLDTVPRRSVPEPPRRHRWLPVVAAAAAVAVFAGGAVWLGNQQGDDPASKDRGVATAPRAAELAVLDDPAWTLEDASLDEYGGELEYHAPGKELTIKWSPSRPFDLYAEDTMEIDGPQVGERLEVLGRKALLFHYSDQDHLAVLEVLDEAMLEIRGEGMTEPAFRNLLAGLTPIAAGDLDAALPERFISDEERPGVIEEMLAPIPLPEGFDASSIESTEWMRYDLGADVVGAVVCEWVLQYRDAMRGDVAIAPEVAQEALATSRDWPILQEMKRQGDYPDVVWEISDEIVAGRWPEESRQGLGCE